MTVLAATTLRKGLYVLFFVLLAAGVAAYGWLRADSIRPSASSRQTAGSVGSVVFYRLGGSAFSMSCSAF